MTEARPVNKISLECILHSSMSSDWLWSKTGYRFEGTEYGVRGTKSGLCWAWAKETLSIDMSDLLRTMDASRHTQSVMLDVWFNVGFQG